MYKRLRPVRAKVWANGWLLLLPLQGVGNGGMVPRALPWARDLLPFQGARGEGCGDSTVAHFARKVRGANVGAQHELKIQQSHAPERWSCSLRVRGPHFASKVSYNAAPQQALQCWRPKAPASPPPTHISPPPFNKSSFCGRDSYYLRPRVARFAAANDDISVMPLTLPTEKARN